MRIALFLVISAPLLLAQEPLLIGPPESPPGESPAEPPGPPVELEAFIDGLMASHFETYHLAGAAAVIVRDGRIEFSKGYGFADLEERRPVDPQTTLFRLASVSKLFTWTAVMQLVERGELDLDEDVNRYLTEVQVPEAFNRPVTLKDLMTHTAGFEDRIVGLFSRSPDQLIPLEEILARDFPKRVRPPGRTASYSNHGTALAGLIVSRISGLPWEEYIERELLEPLGMDHTTGRQPVPEALADDLARGYEWEAGRLEARDFEWIPAAPAGGMSSSGEDMARFLLMHLQDGTYREARILRTETARRMREEVFSHDPRVQGMGYGFILQEINGRGLAGHGGDTFFSHTLFALVPGENLGLFLAYNSTEGARARNEFVELFFDRYFPDPEPVFPDALSGYSTRINQIAGTYRSNRRPQTTLGKLIELFTATEVTSDEAGLIRTSGGLSEEVELWSEVEPYVFVQQGGDERLVFRWNEEESRMNAFLFNLPILAFEKLRWHERPSFHLLILALCLLVLTTTLLLPILSTFIKRNETRLLARPDPSHSAARWLAAFVALTHFIFLGGLVMVLSNPTVVVYGVPYGLKLLLILPLVAAILTLLLILVALLAWKGGYWGVSARFHYSLVTVSALILIWQYSYWNLLGWNY